MYIFLLVLPGIDPGYIRLPQSKKIIYSFYWRTAIVWKNWKCLAERRVWVWWPFARVMLTIYFTITWLGNVWDQPPPPLQCRLELPIKLRFLGFTLRHRNAVTWTCDWHAWFSPIYIFIYINNTTFCNSKFWSLQKASFFSTVVLFLWRAAFCPSSPSL